MTDFEMGTGETDLSGELCDGGRVVELQISDGLEGMVAELDADDVDELIRHLQALREQMRYRV